MNSFNELKKEYKIKDENYYNGERSEIMQFVPGGLKTVLDVGCGTGNFAYNLKKMYNCEAWGIEPNDQVAQIASQKLDKVINNVFSADLPELKGKEFDAIIFNDVLEHLINPDEVLGQCKLFLKKGGYIVASIPNIFFFPVFFNTIILKQDWAYTNFGTLDKTHLRFFTRKSIVRMFEEQGYRVVKIEGINPETPRRYRILNTLLFNRLKDWKYLQFGVQAKLK
jgi:2-polyprenyl-3-methyl-5-hydroxy-6-metoxy-1,4-benzoquinol methylase